MVLPLKQHQLCLHKEQIDTHTHTHTHTHPILYVLNMSYAKQTIVVIFFLLQCIFEQSEDKEKLL